MSVSLHPSSSLGFRRPLTTLVKRSLTITNTNPQPVAFKVKTTAPKLYCVRPNSGRVNPGESVDVSVMLQALKEEPPLNTKCKDKFLIQSTIITPDKENFTLQDLWASSETNDQVYQQKLRVTYLPAEGQVLEEEDESGVAGMTSTMTAAESHYGTVRQSAPPKGGEFSVSDSQGPVHEERAHTPIQDPTDDHSREYSIPIIIDEPTIAPDFVPLVPADEPAPSQEPTNEPEHYLAPIPPVPEPIPEPAPTQVQTPAPVPVPPPALPSQIIIENPVNEELYAKFNLAKQEIDNLKAQIASLQTAAAAPTELRKRTRRTSEPDSAATSDVAQTMLEDPAMQQEGVPLQVVVFIALGVFITTYLFF